MKKAINSYLHKHGFGQFTPKAVLFDMDGVLINSMPNHAIAWQQSMAAFGITMTADDAYATEGARGIDTIRMMVRQQQGREIDEDEAQRMYDLKTHLFGDLPVAPVMNNVKGLLRKIKRDGLRIIVVTGSGQRPLINRLTKEFPQYIKEEDIITAYDVKRGKPNPDPYLMGLQRAGNLQPWEAIVVENAPLGVRAGAAANIFTVAVNSGPLPNKVLADAGADIVFDKMRDLYLAWDSLFSLSHHHLTRDEIWQVNYEQIVNYVNTFKRRPSKHRIEDHRMLNWIKYNKKVMANGDMPPEKTHLFCQLLETLEKYQKLNQYAYVHNTRGEQELF